VVTRYHRPFFKWLTVQPTDHYLGTRNERVRTQVETWMERIKASQRPKLSTRKQHCMDLKWSTVQKTTKAPVKQTCTYKSPEFFLSLHLVLSLSKTWNQKFILAEKYFKWNSNYLTEQFNFMKSAILTQFSLKKTLKTSIKIACQCASRKKLFRLYMEDKVRV
jgi:hypothetical protein